MSDATPIFDTSDDCDHTWCVQDHIATTPIGPKRRETIDVPTLDKAVCGHCGATVRSIRHWHRVDPAAYAQWRASFSPRFDGLTLMCADDGCHVIEGSV